MKQHRTRAVRAVVSVAVASLAAVTLVTTTAGAQSTAKVPGVTDKAVKLGFIWSGTGVASSTFQGSDKACQARVDRANREGGVNGRKIKVEYVDDKSSGANLTAAKDLVENRDVYGVINNSSFGFLSYRYLLGRRCPAGRRRLRRHVLRREGQREHPLRARQLGAVHRPRLRQPHQADEAGGREEGRRRGVRRVVLVGGIGEDDGEHRRTGIGPRPRVPQHHGRLRQLRRRPARARHQERRRRRRVPADGRVVEHRAGAGTRAERREDEVQRADDGLRPVAARLARGRRP